MRFNSLILVGIMALAGCGSGGGTWGGSSASAGGASDGSLGADERTQLAAYAASSQYPDAQPSDDMRLTAVVDRRAGRIRILNPTADASTDVSVWVNRNFVTRVDRIPARGITELDLDRFYNAQGRSLADIKAVVREVQIQRGDKLHNVLGPVYE